MHFENLADNGKYKIIKCSRKQVKSFLSWVTSTLLVSYSTIVQISLFLEFTINATLSAIKDKNDHHLQTQLNHLPEGVALVKKAP